MAGNTFGTNTITLTNGILKISDNGVAAGETGQTLNGYGNNLNIYGLSNTLTLNDGNTNSSKNIVPFGTVTLYNSAVNLTANNTYSYQATNLYGGGTMTGSVTGTVTGTVSPGGNVATNSPQVLNIGLTSVGHLLTISGGTYAPVIAGGTGWVSSNQTNAGITYDQVNLGTGTGGSANITLSNATLNVLIPASADWLNIGSEYFLVDERPCDRNVWLVGGR